MDPARESAVDVLVALERSRATARELLAAHATAADVSERDRALARELVLGAVRRRATLDAVLTPVSRTPIHRLDPVVRAALRTALVQLLLLDRVPVHAAVDGAVRIVKARTNPRLAGFANGVLRTVVRGIEGPVAGEEDLRRDVPRGDGRVLRLRAATFPDAATDPDGNAAVRYALPAWLVVRWRARLTAHALLEALQGSIARPVDADGEATAARLLAIFAPRPADRVLLLAPATGGATRGLGAALRAAGVDLEVAAGLPSDGGPLPPASYDTVVVEPLSTRTGALRRHPDLCDRLRPSDVVRLAAAARALADAARGVLRPGGALGFVTESVEPEEGEAVLAGTGAGGRVEGSEATFPRPATDGGYVGVVRFP